MAKQGRDFTREFEVEAVRRIAAEGESLAEIARELGLGESLLRSRKTALAAEGEQASPGEGHPPAVEEELRHLRAEDRRLRMERETLRKATAFFAGGSS
jgi:transposase